MKSVGFALKTDGKAEVVNDFKEVATAGQDAMDTIADAAEAAADRAAEATEKYTEREIASFKKRAAAAKVAASGAASRDQIDAALGSAGSQQFATVNLDRSAGAAKDSMAVFEQARKAEEDAKRADDERAESLAKIRALLDPLSVAQARYDQELATYNRLRADLGEEQYAAAVALSTKRLTAAKAALEGHSGALGLNRTQIMIAEGATHRFVDSLLAGMSPMRAFMLQAGDVGNILAMDDGGVAGGLAKVRALINPVTIGIAATTAVLITGAAAWLSYSNAVEKFSALSTGSGGVIGATGQGLEASAEAAARAGSMTIGTAREVEAGYVQMGGIGKDVLGGLTVLTKDFAAATGQDTKAAVQQLGQAFQDPIKGAEDLTARFGSLTQTQIEHIRELVQQNDLYGAQRALLADLMPQFDGAAEHANILEQAWHGIENAASGAWNAMGKAIDRALTMPGDVEKLNEIRAEQAYRKNPGTLDFYGTGRHTFYLNDSDADLQKAADQLVAKMNAEVAKSAAKTTNAKTQAATALVNGVLGDDGLGQMKTKLSAVNALLADNGKAAGLNAADLTRARTAQDELNHAVSTYIPEGQRQVQLAQLEAQIAGAKGNPAKIAALNADKARLEQRGKLITSADVEAQAESKATQAKIQASQAGAGHAATLAREAASMEASARAALEVADAYLKSTAAGVEAEAFRKASTDATKKGVDVEAQARRQLDLSVGDGAANGAKAIAALRDETAARSAVNDNVAAGKIAVDDMNQALQDESILRPLLALQAISQGDAYQKLGEIIAAYRAELVKAHAAEADSAALESTDAIRKRIADARLQGQYAGNTSGDYERAKALADANREADAKHFTPDQRATNNVMSVLGANADLDTKRKQAQADALRGFADQNAMTQAQVGLIGKSADEQDRVLANLRLQQQLAVLLGDQYDTYAPAWLAAADATEVANQHLERLQDSWAEVKNFGDQFLDTVLNPSNWSNFGDMAKKVLGDIEQEFIKLAVINPLKNLLFGEKNSTLFGSGGVLSSLGKLFGHNATGTDYWSGGMTWVGENGPELISAPRGSRITNAAAARQMFNSPSGPIGGATHNYFSGNLLTPEWWQQIQAGDDNAAGRGAVGGAHISDRNAAKKARQKLGTR